MFRPTLPPSGRLIRRSRSFAVSILAPASPTASLAVWLTVWLAVWLTATAPLRGQIPRPEDAPQPLTPAESARQFAASDGFRLELVASEPLIREPSDVCWDAGGRMFVSELHGYNLEGQYDIEELNQTGELDRVVRRIQADERHKRKAEKETYGVVKLLLDDNNDGRMDRAVTWADRLPPCHGICAARGGLIAACQTQILFLADRDGDNRAEVREVLFEGFGKGPLERSINHPRWGPDNWIYFGRGPSGGPIRGPGLRQPVAIPATDFRIRADGSAIEPVLGGTGTIGYAFTSSEDRFVVSTGSPGVFVAPLPWSSLARNPLLAPTGLEYSTGDSRVYPTSQPHPWRTRRAEDPGFAKYYTDRYGIRESTPNGYFTSACSPLVYRDTALPDLHGDLLTCEPAQNLVHRAKIHRDGARLHLRRAAEESMREFLTSRDAWFHPIHLSLAPDGTIYIVDFYREIIEDYSAIPRYLQQQYGLINGRNYGRLWRLTHDHLTPSPADLNLADRSSAELADQLGSPRVWRRDTARRLLVERNAEGGDRNAAQQVRRWLRDKSEPAVILQALHTLNGMNSLQTADVLFALNHAAPSVRRIALRMAERRLDQPALLRRAAALVDDPAAMVRLQVAIAMGESSSREATDALASLARRHGDDPWMQTAVLSSSAGRASELFAQLMTNSASHESAAAPLSIQRELAALMAREGNPQTLGAAMVRLDRSQDLRLRQVCLQAIAATLKDRRRATLSPEGLKALRSLSRAEQSETRSAALRLLSLPGIEPPEERSARLRQAAAVLADVSASAKARTAALDQLREAPEPMAGQALLRALPSSTPLVRQSILDALLSRADRLPDLLREVESGRLSPSFFSDVQKAMLISAEDESLRRRAAALLHEQRPELDATAKPYVAAFTADRDLQDGFRVFRAKCAACHTAHGAGKQVGPPLDAEFRRSEESLLRDVLTPSEKISPEYAAYSVQAEDGRVASGIMTLETPTSLTLRQAEGRDVVILRRDIQHLRALPVSLMPANLLETITPTEFANLMAWLRRPPSQLTLFDEDPALLLQLSQGDGEATLMTDDAARGRRCLQVTPLQRHHPRIPGWRFPIRETPGPGEYRYLRFAWKAEGEGVMIELADEGRWPSSDEPLRRYHAGRNTSSWRSTSVAAAAPHDWTIVTRDLWKDFGDFTLTGFAPTALGGPARFDRIELLQSLEEDPVDTE